MKISSFLCFCIFILNYKACHSLFEWLFGEKEADGSDERRIVVASGLKFEVPTADDKFLELKDALDNLSQLNKCYHIVSYKIYILKVLVLQCRLHVFILLSAFGNLWSHYTITVWYHSLRSILACKVLVLAY